MFEYITRDISFDEVSIKNLKDSIPTYYNFPCVYLIYCNKQKQLYIGETTNILNRLKQHIKSDSKNKLKNVTLILSHFFNKSAVLDIESNLIQNMVGENSFKLLNANDGIVNHQYYQKDQYLETFQNIWNEKLLKEKNIVKKDLLDIQNTDLFKYSPYKSLSDDQYNAVKVYLESLLNTEVQSTFIEGSAGTGKTIVAVYIIKLLMSEIDFDDIYEETENHELLLLADKVKNKLAKGRKLKIALVVPMTSLRSTLQNVFKSIYGLSKNMVIGSNDVKKEHYDLLIVDESHRLKQRKNITGYGEFDKTNKHFNLDNNGTELDWIILSSNKQLFFYDSKQSIRPSDVDKKAFEMIKQNSNIISLNSQMRVQGGDDYISFIDSLLSCSKIKCFNSNNYELRLFESMKDLVDCLQEKENSHGLCRLISGYSWQWVSKNKDLPDVVIDGVSLRWNKTAKDWINSTTDVTEMGCIHTTQGYDLNYAGIIFGTDITYNKITNKIEVIKHNYYDRNGKAGINEDTLHGYIINIY
ncbi:DUF2075 domain-containing protein [Francisella philomiragia]|nr:DUF2075 domain-containing protein [Francisella philomiragia]MBK2092934.1 DUF2075 domain-containing protein [Francisella philomiragia]